MKDYEVSGSATVSETMQAESLQDAILVFRYRHGSEFRINSAESVDGTEGGAIIGSCETCRRAIFEGEDYQIADAEGDVYLCAACKFTPEQIAAINADAAADEDIDA